MRARPSLTFGFIHLMMDDDDQLSEADTKVIKEGPPNAIANKHDGNRLKLRLTNALDWRPAIAGLH
jgi:hypothetical protein